MNKALFSGRLTRDPELRRTHDGTAVATCSIAIDDGYKDNKKTFFPTLVVWRHQAEYLAKYAHKGDMIEAVARYTERKWTDRDNNKRMSVEFVCEDVKILTSKHHDQHSDTGHSDYAAQDYAGAFPAPGEYHDITDEEGGTLPF